MKENMQRKDNYLKNLNQKENKQQNNNQNRMENAQDFNLNQNNRQSKNNNQNRFSANRVEFSNNETMRPLRQQYYASQDYEPMDDHEDFLIEKQNQKNDTVQLPSTL